MKTDPVQVPENWRDSVPSIIEVGKIIRRQRETMPYTKYIGWVRSVLQTNESTANKLIKLSSNPIISDPRNFSKLPTQWGKLYELGLMPEDILRSVIEDGSAMTINKYQIWKLRGEGKVKKTGAMYREGYDKKHDGQLTSRTSGGGIILKGDIELLDLCRSGLEMEKTLNLDVTQAAKRIGIGNQSYRMIRAALILDSRDDLSAADRELVQSVLQEIASTKKVTGPYERIRPLVDKIWGVGRNHRIGDKKTESKRLEAFHGALIIVHDTCHRAEEMELPHLSVEDVNSALRQILEARNALRRLGTNIKRSAMK